MTLTIDIETVRTAQRNDPGAQATKDLQRQYEQQRTAARRQRNADAWRERLARKDAECTALRAQIMALGELAVPEGFAFRTLTVAQAQWAGMAPSVAGGWVAILLPYWKDNYLFALVPETWNDGCKIAPSTARKTWIECDEPDQLRDALNKLSMLK